MSRSKTTDKSVSSVPLEMKFDDGLIIRESLDAQGVFTRITIKKNTMVHNDCFVWVVDDPDVKHISYEAQWNDVCKQFSTRNPPLAQAIKELEPKRATGQTVEAWLEAVLKINGWDHFLMRDGVNERVTMLAIYKGSKYNHSCAPNLRVTLRDSVKESGQKTPPETNQPGVRNEFWVTALEDIPKDGEVTVSYLHGEDLKDNDFRKRRALLKKSWGFECNCKKCQSDIALEKEGTRLAPLSKGASATSSKSTKGRMGDPDVVQNQIAANKRKNAGKEKSQARPKKQKLPPAPIPQAPALPPIQQKSQTQSPQEPPRRRVKLVATLPAVRPTAQITADNAPNTCKKVAELPHAFSDSAKFAAGSAVTSCEQDAQLLMFASQLAHSPLQFAKLTHGSSAGTDPTESSKAAKRWYYHI